uniref:SAND domain-containing protein n=1 Tax=Denticeps clupeoides TaxID=299321 RepID=A0AAY4AQS0_9TELE
MTLRCYRTLYIFQNSGLDMASLIKWNNYNQTEEHEKGDELPGSSSQAICSQQQNAPESSYSEYRLLHDSLMMGQQKVIRKRFKDQTEILVTCGTKRGMLNKEKGKCIMSQGRWFTPTEFEEFGGKSKCKNWKTSIRQNEYFFYISNSEFIHSQVKPVSLSSVDRECCVRLLANSESSFIIITLFLQNGDLKAQRLKKRTSTTGQVNLLD